MAKKHYIINNLGTIAFYTVLFLLNFLIFVVNLATRDHSKEHSVTAGISSALGKCLLFDTAVLPITVCRRIIAWIRETPLHVFVPMDNHRSMHRALSLSVCVLAFLHAVAAISSDVLTAKEDENVELVKLLLIPSYRHSGWMKLGLLNVSGFACLLVVLIIVVTSLLRHHMSFLAFFLSHQLYVVLYGLMIMHAGVFWTYLALPVCLWLTELLLRQIKRSKVSNIIEVTLLPSNIVVIVLARPPHLIFKPGDYVFIQIPEIGKLEWVKFTITSAPEQTELMTIHVQITNNWTFRLRNYFLREVSFHYIPHRLQALESITVLQRAYKSWRNLCGDFQNIDVPMGKPRETRKERMQRNQVDAMMVEEKHLTMDVVISEDEIEPEVAPTPVPTKSLMPTATGPVPSKQKIEPRKSSMGTPSKVDTDRSKIEVQASQFGGFASGYSAFTSNYGKTLHFDCDDVPRTTSQHPRHSLVIAMEDQETRVVVPARDPTSKDGATAASPKDTTKDTTTNTGSSVPKLPNIGAQKGAAQPPKIVLPPPPVINVLPSDQEDTSITISMKKRGDFSGEDIEEDDNYFARKIQVFVDGPYGNTGNERTGIFSPKHAIIILVGPKVEPLASVLQSILIRYRSEIVPCPNCACEFKMLLPSSFMNIRKVDFVWVNNDVEGFEWFLELLEDMDYYQRQRNLLENFLEFYLFKTGIKPMPSFTPLRKQLLAGRPKWDELLRMIVEKSQGGMEVFFSGPRAAKRIVKRSCKTFELPFNSTRF